MHVHPDIQQAITQNQSIRKAIDQVLGRSGNLQGETYRVGFPRSDFHVTVGAVKVRPSLALGSWVAFKQTGDGTVMLMGDLCCWNPRWRQLSMPSNAAASSRRPVDCARRWTRWTSSETR